MKHFINILLIFGTLLFIASIGTFEGLSYVQSCKAQEQQIIQIVLPIKNELFQSSIEKKVKTNADFIKLDRIFQSNVHGFVGFQFKQKDEVLYQTKALDKLLKESIEWKKPVITNDGIRKQHLTAKQVTFENVLSNTQFIFYYDTIHDNFILSSLQFGLLALISYLLFLILVVFIIYLSSKKSKQTPKLLEEPQKTETTDENAILPLPTLEKIEDVLQTAIKNKTDFSVAAISQSLPCIEEGRCEEAYSYLETYLDITKGFYELSGSIMYLIFPEAALQKGLHVVQNYFSILKEADETITFNGGVTSLNNRELTADILINEATKALEKAERDNTELLGFNADPDRYKNRNSDSEELVVSNEESTETIEPIEKTAEITKPTMDTSKSEAPSTAEDEIPTDFFTFDDNDDDFEQK